MISWTIKGESGKTFNATVRSLADAKIDGAVLNFRNLEADTLEFSITPEDLLTATIPENGQSITLYRDGVQFFLGNVTNVRSTFSAGIQKCQVTVSGPWWWLEKIPFTSTQTDGTGATAERLSYVFGTSSEGQNLRDSLIAAIDRSVALGVPMANYSSGAISGMTTFPRITLNQSSCAFVISELVRLVPDCMVYFDYAVTPPRMIIQRRSGATTRTINVLSSPVESIDIQPVIELQVSQVVLPYIDRDIQGRTRFQSQSSGTNVTGKRQIITVSGPELDTFLPNDLFDSYAIKTVAPASATNFVLNQDGSLVSLAKESGYSNGRLPLAIQTLGGVSLWISQSSSISTPPAGTYQRSLAIPAPTLTGIDGTAYSTSTRKIIITSDLPDWVKTELGINIKEVVFEGYLGALHTYRLEYGSPTVPLPTWWESVGFDLQIDGFTLATSNGSRVVYGFKKFSVKCFITTAEYATNTTVYRPADYSFIQPPAGLAAFLVGAQNWLPYEGTISLVEEDVGATRYRGTKVRISNSMPEFATMDALVESESLDIATGTTTINLGAPPRNDYRNLVDKIRKTSQDNIVYL
jgi:hypothetical protein